MSADVARWVRLGVVAALVGAWMVIPSRARGDGMVVPMRDYKGSLEERAQEALILFHAGDEARPATEDLILKIRVEGDASAFAWIVALPNEPTTAPEDGKLFEELHRYVQEQKTRARADKSVKTTEAKAAPAPSGAAAVEVISRKDVGSYDVAVVREKEPGTLNAWLADNGYRRVEGADDLFEWYRKKNYVFACVRVNDAAREKGTAADLHPLRFSFATGGRDGVYFPMRLTGLQSSRFDVNLYILYNKWLNDRLNGFGFAHRGFTLNWRDYDGPQCVPNAGKRWSDPGHDPYLGSFAHLIPAVTKLCQKLHPGERYYLTNLQASSLAPGDVRAWADDLWLFPYYTDPRTVPHDARKDGPASSAYPNPEAMLPAASPTRGPVRWRPMWSREGLIAAAAWSPSACPSSRSAWSRGVRGGVPGRRRVRMADPTGRNPGEGRATSSRPGLSADL